MQLIKKIKNNISIKLGLFYFISSFILGLLLFLGALLYEKVDSRFSVEFENMGDYFLYFMWWTILALIIFIFCYIIPKAIEQKDIQVSICILSSIVFGLWLFKDFQSSYEGIRLWITIISIFVGVLIFFINQFLMFLFRTVGAKFLFKKN